MPNLLRGRAGFVIRDCGVREVSKIYTIGTRGWSAAAFLRAVTDSGARTLFDLRPCPTPLCKPLQCGYARGYLYRRLPGVQIVLASDFAPDVALLEAYCKRGDWDELSGDYVTLMEKRSEKIMVFQQFWSAGHDIILLSSEHKADRCYRSLAASYIAEKAWRDLHLDLIVEPLVAPNELWCEEGEDMPGCAAGL